MVKKNRKVLYLSIQDLKDLGILKKYNKRKHKKRYNKYLLRNDIIKSQSNMGSGYTQQQEPPRFTNTSNLNSENTRLNNLLIENQINKNKNDNNDNNDIENKNDNPNYHYDQHNYHLYLKDSEDRFTKKFNQGAFNNYDNNDNIDVVETYGSNEFSNTTLDELHNKSEAEIINDNEEQKQKDELNNSIIDENNFISNEDEIIQNDKIKQDDAISNPVIDDSLNNPIENVIVTKKRVGKLSQNQDILDAEKKEIIKRFEDYDIPKNQYDNITNNLIKLRAYENRIKQHEVEIYRGVCIPRDIVPNEKFIKDSNIVQLRAEIETIKKIRIKKKKKTN